MMKFPVTTVPFQVTFVHFLPLIRFPPVEVSKELRSLQEDDMLEVIGGIHVWEL